MLSMHWEIVLAHDLILPMHIKYAFLTSILFGESTMNSKLGVVYKLQILFLAMSLTKSRETYFHALRTDRAKSTFRICGNSQFMFHKSPSKTRLPIPITFGTKLLQFIKQQLFPRFWSWPSKEGILQLWVTNRNYHQHKVQSKLDGISIQIRA